MPPGGSAHSIHQSTTTHQYQTHSPTPVHPNAAVLNSKKCSPQPHVPAGRPTACHWQSPRSSCRPWLRRTRHCTPRCSVIGRGRKGRQGGRRGNEQKRHVRTDGQRGKRRTREPGSIGYTTTVARVSRTASQRITTGNRDQRRRRHKHRHQGNMARAWCATANASSTASASPTP